MQIITGFLVAILTSYISFTNQLAEHVITWFPGEDSSLVAQTKDTSNWPKLPSVFQTVPDILLRSIDFQRASVGDAVRTSLYTTDPLEAIVNIFCTFITPTSIRTTTGTGFFIHSDGVIITNAHVAQYLLLESTDLLGNAECTVRKGNPAVATYRAELLYIPPAWVQKNAALIDVAVPMGTGERDYALLYVSGSLTSEPLPARFPALNLATESLPRSSAGLAVTVAGYPAINIESSGFGNTLTPQSAPSYISELYTFGSNQADVFSIKGTKVGAQGSSGGPIVNASGEAIGMIVTRGDDNIDGPGSLRAITLAHINRTILEETGFSLERNVTGNLPYRSDIFKSTLAPFLLALLSTELKN